MVHLQEGKLAMSLRTRATAAINATVNAGIKAFWSDYGFSGSNTSGGGVYGSGSHRVPDQVRRYRNTDAAESSLIAAAVEFKGREMRNIRFVAQRFAPWRMGGRRPPRKRHSENAQPAVRQLGVEPRNLLGYDPVRRWLLAHRAQRQGCARCRSTGCPSRRCGCNPREWRPGIETTYIYQPSHGAGRMTLVEADVIHFRHGISAGDPRRGVSPIASLLEEVGVDEEAARYAITACCGIGAMPGPVGHAWAG